LHLTNSVHVQCAPLWMAGTNAEAAVAVAISARTTFILNCQVKGTIVIESGDRIDATTATVLRHFRGVEAFGSRDICRRALLAKKFVRYSDVSLP
jgi:hypothetical protein